LHSIGIAAPDTSDRYTKCLLIEAFYTLCLPARAVKRYAAPVAKEHSVALESLTVSYKGVNYSPEQSVIKFAKVAL